MVMLCPMNGQAVDKGTHLMSPVVVSPTQLRWVEGGRFDLAVGRSQIERVSGLEDEELSDGGGEGEEVRVGDLHPPHHRLQ